MIKTINNFSEIVKDIFTLGNSILPREIRVIFVPIFSILIAILIYKIIRKALI